jgi:5-methylcytosine-specific restriction endonuclease McrBC regulatory subunit McrC
LNGTNLIKNAFYTATDGIRYRRSDLYNTKHFSNPFYSEYNEVIDLSKLILRDELSDFGEKSNNSAFFFDISMLFEYFVRKLLKRNGFVLESKFEKRLEIPSGVNHFQRKIEPDIVFHLQGNAYVFDVKYKTFDFKYGVNREDIFQLHTYIGQYGNISDVKACGFIYPISQTNWEKMGLETKDGVIQNKINVMGKLIEFYVILIKIPDDHEGNFRELFNKSCECFINIFSQKILK